MRKIILLITTIFLFSLVELKSGPECKTPNGCWNTDINEQDPNCTWEFELAIVPLPNYPECEMAVRYCKRTCPLPPPSTDFETQIYIYWTQPTSTSPSDCIEKYHEGVRPAILGVTGGRDAIAEANRDKEIYRLVANADFLN